MYDDGRFAPPAPLANITLRHPDSGNTLSDGIFSINSGNGKVKSLS